MQGLWNLARAGSVRDDLARKACKDLASTVLFMGTKAHIRANKTDTFERGYKLARAQALIRHDDLRS